MVGQMDRVCYRVDVQIEQNEKKLKRQHRLGKSPSQINSHICLNDIPTVQVSFVRDAQYYDGFQNKFRYNREQNKNDNIHISKAFEIKRKKYGQKNMKKRYITNENKNDGWTNG